MISKCIVDVYWLFNENMAMGVFIGYFAEGFLLFYVLPFS
jgi:hypothetical protein